MNLTNKELREYSQEHIRYEIEMLLAVSRVRVADQFLTNIRVESFALHLRNLITFLYPSEIKPTDVCAEHFFSDPSKWKAIRPPLSKTLKDARRRSSKEVSHLTVERISGTPNNKNWEIDLLVKEIINVFRIFCNSADTTKLDDSVLGTVSQ